MTIARDALTHEVVGQVVFPLKNTGQDVCLLTKDGYVYVLRSSVRLEELR